MISYEEWFAKHVTADPNIERDLADAHGINMRKEMDAILKAEYDTYVKSYMAVKTVEAASYDDYDGPFFPSSLRD
jgi:hypothetical protein